MPVSDVEKKINVAVTEFLLKYMRPTLDPQRVFEVALLTECVDRNFFKRQRFSTGK